MDQHTPKCDICATPRYCPYRYCAPATGKISDHHLRLILEWKRRAEAVGLSERDIEKGIEEIFEEFRTCGEIGGAEYLKVWAQMLRDQNLKQSVQ